MCLSRSLLRRDSTRVLLLDEATAAVDARTDAVIRDVVDAEFKCTVVVIAHRLDTIMDCDRVIIMSDGCVVEVGNPYQLAEDEGSIFSRLRKKNSS